MTRTDVGDLALLEEPVADHVTDALLLGLSEQPDRRVYVGQVMFGLRDLRFIGRDPTENLSPLVLQGLNDQWFAHATLNREHVRPR